VVTQKKLQLTGHVARMKQEMLCEFGWEIIWEIETWNIVLSCILKRNVVSILGTISCSCTLV
jgi:hypothetical protein